MKIYRVGGAVRDRLLGLPVKDIDWVVVGATVEEMRAQGYRQVGRDFPVFLHPDSGEEYALARTERKQGRGYTGFQVYASPDITLEEDLERRDLTINAMAEDEQGNLIDPFKGQEDLEQGLLRHVSSAFEEDPLRVLRSARFAARFHSLGFRVAEETQALMRQLSHSGELDHLIPERVWQETARALMEDSPQTFFRVLQACDALAVLFPELHALFGMTHSLGSLPSGTSPSGSPQPTSLTKVDSGEHSLQVLEQSVSLSKHLPVRFAALCHALGKAHTSQQDHPQAQAEQTEAGLSVLGELCQRLRVPKDCQQLAALVIRHQDSCHHALEADAHRLLKLLESCDAFRQPERFNAFLLACEAEYRVSHAYAQKEESEEVGSSKGGKGSKENKEIAQNKQSDTAAYQQAAHLKEALRLCQQVPTAEIVAAGFKGEAVGRELHARRRQALDEWLTSD